MNTGVYCRPRSTTDVYDSIIIDRYSKIFNETQIKDPMDSLGPSSECTNSSEEEKWECGMNVRAPFTDDNKYYEATIEKIFDEYAVVRFLGYENEEAVKLKNLRPSMGEESISEQMKKANEENNKLDDDEAIEDLEWEVGMSCRALYEPNEIVYEAVIQEVSKKDRKAIVMMAGYGIPYEVNFENMYESIPELRVKQEIAARNHIASKTKAESNLKEMSSDMPNPLGSGRRNDSNETRNFPSSANYVPNDRTFLENPNINPVTNHAFSNCQGMVQPQNENDALACLISSNYLSGYYAGYFDCLKKFQNSNNRASQG